MGVDEHAPPHMCHHTEFDRSKSKGVDIREYPKNWERAEPRRLGPGRAMDLAYTNVWSRGLTSEEVRY